MNSIITILKYERIMVHFRKNTIRWVELIKSPLMKNKKENTEINAFSFAQVEFNL